jgi:hypothetical protein
MQCSDSTTMMTYGVVVDMKDNNLTIYEHKFLQSRLENDRYK